MIHFLSSFVFLLFCFSSSSFSQALPKWTPDSGYSGTQTGNKVTFSGPSANSGSFSFPSASNSGSYSVSGSSTGVTVTQPKNIAVGSRTFSVNVAKDIPWKNVAKGIAVVARGGVHVAVASVAVDWFAENGIRWIQCAAASSGCDGSIQWQTKAPDVYPTDPNRDYRWSLIDAPWRRTAQEVIQLDIIPYYQSQLPGSCVPTLSPSNCRQLGVVQCEGPTCISVLVDVRSPYDIANGVPLWSPNSFYRRALTTRGKLLAPDPNSGWQDSPPPDFDNNPPKAPDPGLAPDLWVEGLPGGIPDTGAPPVVNGPSSVPGSSSSSTGPNGTTNTTNNYNITYNGDTVTVNNIQTVTHTSPDGSTTTEQTTEEAEPEPREDIQPPADPDMPEVPTLYEKKYPDGLAGVWATRKAQLQTTPIFSFLASLVPSTGDGGCPSWQLPVMYGIKNTSVVDISIPCWIWSAIRAIFVVTALLSCRRIIFGG